MRRTDVPSSARRNSSSAIVTGATWCPSTNTSTAIPAKASAPATRPAGPAWSRNCCNKAARSGNKNRSRVPGFAGGSGGSGFRRFWGSAGRAIIRPVRVLLVSISKRFRGLVALRERHGGRLADCACPSGVSLRSTADTRAETSPHESRSRCKVHLTLGQPGVRARRTRTGRAIRAAGGTPEPPEPRTPGTASEPRNPIEAGSTPRDSTLETARRAGCAARHPSAISYR